jgi:hypothetical protein
VANYLKYLNTAKLLIQRTKFVFTPIALLFLVYFGWQSRGIMAGILDKAQFLFLLISTLLWFFLHFISPLFTIILFRSCKHSISYIDAFYIHASRLPAKYLPGGIWHSVARGVDYNQKKITPRYVGVYLLLENIIAASVTLLIGGLIMVRIPQLGNIWSMTALIFSTIAFCILLLLPIVADNYFLPKQDRLIRKHYIKSVICIAFYWVIAAVSFVCFLKAFPELIISVTAFEAGGIYMFSWGIGFITLFAPQGIGVSESISGSLLEANITISSMIAFLAGFRVLVLLADLIAWFVSRLVTPEEL